jgi:hypothetical protein
MIQNIHIHNNPIGTKANKAYKLFAFDGTENGRHQYYGLVWATNTDHARDIVQRHHFQIDELLVWLWPADGGTPGWGVAGFDQAMEIALMEVDA